MFDRSRLEEVESKIKRDLKIIDETGSVKIYLCCYDEFMVSKESWNGFYPCSTDTVSVHEIINLIKKVFKRPCIIRHNILLSPIPLALNAQAECQDDFEKYIEVCLVY